ncbi:MAG: hypothetical protein FWE87_02885 [Coriobacteriia bacterium]|nr:hypothetical protein [Coriobacteriia bacterium]
MSATLVLRITWRDPKGSANEAGPTEIALPVNGTQRIGKQVRMLKGVRIMSSRILEIGLVEMVILVGAILAFLVHPAMFFLASVRALVLSLVKPRAAQKVSVVKGTPVLAGGLE